MRQRFFGPLIDETEARLARERGARYDRKSFEDEVKNFRVRTPAFRYTRSIKRRDPAAPPLAEEFYDHRTSQRETTNVAGDPRFASQVKQGAELRRQVLPPAGTKY